ncbi:replication/maintenance protein RepL [Pseudoalteromonas luteoviolacea]|uniref:replication/maintenance protein RepL n=1 Tax=Pseudoalteromonas luteoviolacea TaxID=43657 RepID=UPI001EEF5AFC|nr:replication/maintenance protein RepL [Pseudoalteromonas luteoviolacea]MCF6438047.1 replication/maintenance protein RepL [Pseudoalteromonas luteoviolacea]
MKNIFTPEKKQQSLARTTSKSVQDKSGNIIESQTVDEYKSYKDSEPSFVKEYLQDQTKLDNLKKGTVKIFKRLFPLVVFNDNLIILNASIKKDLCLTLGIQLSTLNNALNELKKSQLLIHIDTGVYMLNVFYYAKGHWSEIKKIRSQISCNVIHSDPNDESSPVKNIEFNFDKLIINKDKYNSVKKRQVPDTSKSEKLPKGKNTQTHKISKNKKTLISTIIELFQFNKLDRNNNTYINQDREGLKNS